MNPEDLFMVALCCWREARNQLEDGMTAVAWVIRNRSLKHQTSPYFEVTKKLQFSSITAPGDTQLSIWPIEADGRWQDALQIAQKVWAGSMVDPTDGATLYYNPDAIEKGKTITLKSGLVVAFPKGWNAAAVIETTTVGSRPLMHVFFQEK